MNSDTLASLKLLLPNFPEEILIDWIEPYARNIGLPPNHERWPGILAGKSLEFWQSVSWSKESMDLSTALFSESTVRALQGMHVAYTGGNNPYALIENGQERSLSAFKYFAEHGSFPKPICLLRENGGYLVADGNHRLLAWQTYRHITNAVENATSPAQIQTVKAFKETLMRKWSVQELATLSNTQQVWVAWAE